MQPRIQEFNSNIRMWLESLTHGTSTLFNLQEICFKSFSQGGIKGPSIGYHRVCRRRIEAERYTFCSGCFASLPRRVSLSFRSVRRNHYAGLFAYHYALAALHLPFPPTTEYSHRLVTEKENRSAAISKPTPLDGLSRHWGSNTTPHVIAVLNTAPTRKMTLSLPVELWEYIGYHALAYEENFLGSLIGLTSLLLINKRLHSALSFPSCPRLYARLFCFKFDHTAPVRRLSSRWLTAPCLAAELRKRLLVLKRLREHERLENDDLWTCYMMYVSYREMGMRCMPY